MNVDGDLMAADLVDMATSVAMEMEEKRRQEEYEKMMAEAKVKPRFLWLFLGPVNNLSVFGSFFPSVENMQDTTMFHSMC